MGQWKSASRLGIAILSLCSVGDALMFQSSAVSSQWDTWAFVENGTFYAYYLITEQSPGEGFGVATSTDGQHWIDHGYVWHGPSWAEHRWWEGTGAVWRAADFNKTGRYVINYSECPGGYQNITFAESFDLIHWTRPDPFNKTYFNIDTRYYRNPGRWDCIYSIPQPGAGGDLRDGYPRYGFWTATPINGMMGFGQTFDGWNWEALPSPEMIPPISGEVGAVEYFSVGSSSSGKWFAILGHGGMVTYSAEDPKGPYYAATENYQVLTGSCYFARFFRSGNEVLVTHQAFSHAGHTYIAPYKLAQVDDKGILRFKFWQANNNFKGAQLSLKPNSSSPYFSSNTNISKGIFLEANLTLLSGDSSDDPLNLPGFVLEHIDGKATLVAITSHATCIVSELSSATGGKSGPLQVWNRSLSVKSGESVALKLLYRRDMVELYINDYLFPVYLMDGVSSGRIGLLPNAASKRFTSMTGWTMSLPGTAVWPSIPPPPPPQPVPEGDIAPHGVASCDGYFMNQSQYRCALANDGDLSTRWSSSAPYDGSPRWIEIDMRAVTVVRSVRLSWERAFASGYSIQTSSDASSWITAYNTTAGKGGVETISNLSMTARFFRVYCFKRFPTSQWGFSLYEVELFSTPQPPLGVRAHSLQ